MNGFLLASGIVVLMLLVGVVLGRFMHDDFTLDDLQQEMREIDDEQLQEFAARRYYAERPPEGR